MEEDLEALIKANLAKNKKDNENDRESEIVYKVTQMEDHIQFLLADDPDPLEIISYIEDTFQYYLDFFMPIYQEGILKVGAGWPDGIQKEVMDNGRNEVQDTDRTSNKGGSETDGA